MAFSGDASLFLVSQMVLGLALCIIEVTCVVISCYHDLLLTLSFCFYYLDALLCYLDCLSHNKYCCAV